MAIYGGKKKDIDAESEPYSMDEDLQGLLRATDGFHEVVTVALGGEAAAVDGEQCQPHFHYEVQRAAPARPSSE